MTELNYMNTDGSFGDMSSAPESVSTLIGNKGFKDVAGLVEGYNSEVAFKGTMKKNLNLPETLTDDMTKRIHTKLGRPDTPDGYDFGDASKTFKPEVLSGIKGLAHAQGLNPAQATAVVNQILEIANVQIAGEQAEEAKVEAALKEKHGDKYDAYMEEAFNVSETLGITETLDKFGLNRKPEIIEMLHAMNSKLSEATLAMPGRPIAESQDIDGKIKEITESEAYTNRMHVDHHKTMVELKGLLAQKHNMQFATG